ncbi:MAG: DinB family protein [Saprospiraceae bacterium]|nr:DinB family protein [Saprospiraceae bacterium]
MHNRRNFIQHTAALSVGMAATPLSNIFTRHPAEEEGLYLIGPRKGYTPRVGTLLSTMTMMRAWVVRQVEDLTVEELDFQIDDQSNSIGAMLWHLAATEKYYQLNTFDGMAWGTWSQEIKDEWDVAMSLGEPAREKIKGYDIGFYLEKLENVRKVTEREFAKRDDDWLMESEPFFGNEPTNNHCKWFHVCEHESNHNGQIKFIKKRLPS